MYDESVLFLSENGQSPNANLFFMPKQILQVCSADYETVYREGVDWQLRDGKLYLPKESAIPFMDAGQLHFYSEKTQDCFGAKDGSKLMCLPAGSAEAMSCLTTPTMSIRFR